jgi:hypothetical protein
MKNYLKYSMKNRILAVILTLLLTGCYWNTPVIDLISPPKLTAEQNEIFNALTNTKASALTLKYPKTGEFLSAFVFRPDVNDSVMVFYEPTGVSEPTVFLMFMEKQGGEWVCTYEEPFFATDIERVEFSDLGDSERENIIISYSILNQQDKSLCVISFDDSGKPLKVYERNFCVYYEIGDFDDSGNNTLVSINRSGGDVNESLVYFARWQEGQFRTFDSIDANPNATEYVKSVSGFLHDGRAAIFLEYSQTDNFFNTGIILFDLDGSRPRNVVFTRNESRREEHLRLLNKRPNQYTAHAYARDIDGSGIVRVAGNNLLPGYLHSSFSEAERVRCAIWYDIDMTGVSERLVPRYFTYLSTRDDYVFFFPDDWQQRNVTLTVNNSPNENALQEIVFWHWDNDEYNDIRDVTAPILRILTVAKGQGLCEERSSGTDENSPRWILYDSTTNPGYDFYVQIIGGSIRLRELRRALVIL